MADLVEVITRNASDSCEKKSEELLMYAKANGFLEIPPFLKAVLLGHPSEVKRLLAEGVDASVHYGELCAISALDAAALMGNLGVMRALLEHGANVNNTAAFEGKTTLHTIVSYGRADPSVVDLLLSAGADIDARWIHDLAPLHLAAEPNTGDAATTLLSRGADKDALDDIGHSPLHVAAEHGNLAATRDLLGAGADANLRTDNHKLSPLDVAAFNGHAAVIRELVRHGVDVNAAAPNVVGYTALHMAAGSNNPRAVDALVEAGASVTSQKVHDGSTPLHQAAEFIAPESVLALLRHGAPVCPSLDDRIERHSEPLVHTAARQGGKKGAAEVVDLLLRWGADECELDEDGNTAAEVVGAHVLEEYSLAADADRVRKLLANAPADRAWRRRGLLLLCLARIQTARWRRGSGSGSGGKEKGKGAEEKMLANGGGDGDSGGGGSFSRRADVGLSATSVKAGRSTRESTPSKVGDRRASPDCGGRDNVDSSEGGGGGEGDPEHGGDLDDVVASLLEFQQEGFFRTIVGYL